MAKPDRVRVPVQFFTAEHAAIAKEAEAAGMSISNYVRSWRGLPPMPPPGNPRIGEIASIGGHASAGSLSKKERKARSQKALDARWKKTGKD